jgi:CheY-like chemotaxis protein
METEQCLRSLVKHVLIVDRNADIQLIVQTSLRRFGGWRANVASSGQEGLAMALLDQPDAIVLEGLLPDMECIEFLHQLRLNQTTKAIPVVFLTENLCLTEQYRLFTPLGVVGAIAKPFHSRQLAAQIATALGWKLESAE